MIIEYAQLLAAAHRIIDGTHERVQYVTKSGKTRTKSVWTLPDPDFDEHLYAATHVNHPSAVWTRENISNYLWVKKLWQYCNHEYTQRYGRTHKTWTSQHRFLLTPPNNISKAVQSPIPLCMPDKYHSDDAVQSYRDFYVGDKAAFAKWKTGLVPEWFKGE